jgi:hypothetical protein
MVSDTALVLNPKPHTHGIESQGSLDAKNTRIQDSESIDDMPVCRLRAAIQICFEAILYKDGGEFGFSGIVTTTAMVVVMTAPLMRQISQ